MHVMQVKCPWVGWGARFGGREARGAGRGARVWLPGKCFRQIFPQWPRPPPKRAKRVLFWAHLVRSGVQQGDEGRALAGRRQRRRGERGRRRLARHRVRRLRLRLRMASVHGNNGRAREVRMPSWGRLLVGWSAEIL